MKKQIPLWLALLAVVMAVSAFGTRSGDLIVHEWGTFLSMSGADGVTLDGMYHDEHALPAFVHSRAKDQLRLSSADVKGETPVIYFYTNRRQRVNVSVGFPSGIWTQWYPQASMVGPSLATTPDALNLRDGRIRWNVELLPAVGQSVAVPKSSEDALWNFAREVDSAFVRVEHGAIDLRQRPALENERFIFYRGLGKADLPLQFSATGSGTITCSASSEAPLRHIFVIQVLGGRGAYKYFSSLKQGTQLSGAIPSIKDGEQLDSFSRKAGDDLAARLVESGLYEKEARAMVNTWRASYLESDGIRVLYVLPQSWTDSFIPMKVTPAPASLVRVMVGRTELLTPDRERAAEAAIRNLSSSNSAVRMNAFESLRAQGRYVEPIVRRTMKTSRDEGVVSLCCRLLQTDYVTELRSALKDAATGGKTYHHPVYARARLAQLLRDIGLGAEAAEEGRSVMASLRSMTQPKMDEHDARHYLRAAARASEGIGDDAAAVNWYGKFVRFGSQSPQCGGCHLLEGPRDMAFYRDWWAGARYARYAGKTGQKVALIARHEKELAANSANVEARLALAYLYGASGDRASADRMWSSLIGTTRKAAGN